jgi:ParB/RepB/Spo0J family partition protein
MNIENVDLSKLSAYENNAKKHSAKQIESIAHSIAEFGFNSPILIDENNIIIAGHGRYYAAKSLKLKEVPCVKLSHMSEEQKKAYILADNKLSEIGGGYDEEMLKKELEFLEHDIALTIGFDEKEIDRLFDSINLEDSIQSEPELIREDKSNKQADLIFANVKKLYSNSPELFQQSKCIVLSPRGSTCIVFSDPNTKDVVEEIKRYIDIGEDSPLALLIDSVHKL